MFVKHNSGVFQLIVAQIIHLISILVDIYTAMTVYQFILMRIIYYIGPSQVFGHSTLAKLLWCT